jgi:hypothetical protein
MAFSTPDWRGKVDLRLHGTIAVAFFALWCGMGAEGAPPPVNPVYGTASKTIASDDAPVAIAVPRRREELVELFGGARQTSFSRIPNRTNLLIGETELSWSRARKGFGYLQFCLPSMAPIPVWEFARCAKSNLAQVVAEDLSTQFVSFSDRTNHSGVGQAVFGTNWLRHSIQVEEGQLILARLARNHGKVYVLQFAEQSLTNAVVFYIETPRDKLTMPAQRPPL